MVGTSSFVWMMLLAAAGGAVCGTAHGAIHEDNGFYIEYPDGWTYTDDWDGLSSITFAEDVRGGGMITVTSQDSYVVVDRFDRRQAGPHEITAGFLKTITDGHQTACRNNTYGPCWDYRLLDGTVTTAGTKTAILTSYQARISDVNLSIHTMIVPDGDRIWVVEARMPQDDPAASMEALQDILSFEPDGAARGTADDHEIDEVMGLIADGEPVILEKTIRVNLIMVGAEWSRHEISAISQRIPESYEPRFTIPDEEVGIRYLYEPEFISETGARNLTGYMLENSIERPLYGMDLFEEPVWLGAWVAANHPEWTHYEYDGRNQRLVIDIPYRLVDALKMEEYIYKEYVSPHSDRNGPYTANLVFLKLDLNDAGYLRNYHIVGGDKASGKETEYTGLMGFGGTHNMFFYDLYAAPWLDYDLDANQYRIPPHAASLHDCAGSRCAADMISDHVDGALRHIVTPSFLYPVESHQKHLVDLLVYVMPGGRTTITPASIGSIMNVEAILDEMEYLYPYAQWEMNISVERRDTRGLSNDFKRQFEERIILTVPNPFGPDRAIKLINHTRIQPYLLEWSGERVADAAGDARTIPVLLAVDDSNADVYLGHGFLGIAPGTIGEESDPCCAMVVTNSDDAWRSGIGPTNLILHEVGHILGLHHPFVSFDEYGADFYDRYYNWYASPMTYSAPVSAWTCGTLYGLLYEEVCGNSALSFTPFERERVSDARLLWLLREIGDDDPSSSTDMREIVSRFLAGDILSERGALSRATEMYAQDRAG